VLGTLGYNNVHGEDRAAVPRRRALARPPSAARGRAARCSTGQTSIRINPSSQEKEVNSVPRRCGGLKIPHRQPGQLRRTTTAPLGVRSAKVYARWRRSNDRSIRRPVARCSSATHQAPRLQMRRGRPSIIRSVQRNVCTTNASVLPQRVAVVGFSTFQGEVYDPMRFGLRRSQAEPNLQISGSTLTARTPGMALSTAQRTATCRRRSISPAALRGQAVSKGSHGPH
jgi:hypothetical protein